MKIIERIEELRRYHSYDSSGLNLALAYFDSFLFSLIYVCAPYTPTQIVFTSKN